MATGAQFAEGPSDPQPAIYIVDGDPESRERARDLVGDLGPRVLLFESGCSFLATVSRAALGCVVLDSELPDLPELDVLRILQERKSLLKVVVTVPAGRVGDAVQAMREGAMNCLQKPYQALVFRNAVRGAIAESEAAAIIAAERRAAAKRLARLDPPHATVVRLSFEGLQVKQIAGQMQIGLRTAERYRAEALRRLEVRNIFEAAELYRKALEE